MIKVKKGGFTLVPEGRQIVRVDSVELKPKDKPQVVEFVYSHEEGGMIKETFKFDSPLSVDILGKRCDIALNGTAEEGTEIAPEDLKELFLGKKFEVEIRHREGTKGGTFANIKYMIRLLEDEDDL